jgi:hypothetical protein
MSDLKNSRICQLKSNPKTTQEEKIMKNYTKKDLTCYMLYAFAGRGSLNTRELGKNAQSEFMLVMSEKIIV